MRTPILAFDREWIVDHSSLLTTGEILSELCDQLEREGLLPLSDFRQWTNAEPEDQLKHHRPATWNGFLAKPERITEWFCAVPVAIRSGNGRRYYIKEDVIRRLPAPIVCPTCECAESASWSPQALDGLYYCSEDCLKVAWRKAWVRIQAEDRRRKREMAKFSHCRKLLKDVRKYLRNQKGESLSA